MNITQLNVIQNNPPTFNEIKIIKVCAFTLVCLKPRLEVFVSPCIEIF